MSGVGLLFPGQGAQFAGMGAEFYRAGGAFRETFDALCEAARMDLRAVCFEGHHIDETAWTQPAVYAVSVSTFMALRERGIVPARCAGLSLGEYGALAAAGVLDAAAGAALVRERGRLMGQFDGTGGMAAVAGLTEAQTEALVREHFAGRRLYVCNYNLPAQQVVGGDMEPVEEFCRRAMEAGAKMAKLLRTSGPFHTPLLRPAGEGLRRALAEVRLASPRCPVYSNVLGAPYGDGADAAGLLVRQVSEPVRWLPCMTGMLEEGILAEMGPGATLSGMIRRLDRRKPVAAVNTPADLDMLQSLLEKGEGTP